ncbi:hypothetical protein DFH09DRAFT_1180112 [Mycena vulgaris]|nr:hypothetical protein DFH09DRAFT_1180112 [Mycena vulgaris]
MHLPLTHALRIAVLGLVSIAHAHTSPPSPNDLHCPKGSYPGFVHNSYTYAAPVHKFTDITRSFFDDAWYAGAAAPNNTGTDNVPGATRAGDFGGAFNETLTAYSLHPDAFSFTLHGAPWTYTAPAPQASNLKRPGPLHFAGYAETLRFESICDGRATYIDAITYLCADDKAAAYDLWYNLHLAVFPPLAARVGAKVLAGDCPGA